MAERNAVEPNKEDIFYAVRKVHEVCKGGYAVVVLIAGVGMVAFRDTDGIRPLTYGTYEHDGNVSHMVASESVALDINGFTLQGDVLAGEALFINQNGDLYREQCGTAKPLSPCLFEYVYLARPDSILNDVPVYQARVNMGIYLANKIKREWENYQDDIDVVIAVPETSRTAAIEIARVLDIPLREGFVKNRYVGRTFIMPGQNLRTQSVRRKLNPIASEFSGKKVLLVDDSIVRGTTSSKIIEMLKRPKC